MWSRVWNVALLALSLSGLVACKVEIPPSQVIIQGDVQANLSCTATVNGTSVLPGQPITIDVKGLSGVAPYSISGVSSNFSSFTTITRTYTNNTNLQIVVQDSVTVADSQGHSATCGFQLTVLASGGNNGSLACQIVGSQDNVLPDTAVTYTMVANGTGAISFSNFQGGDSAVVVSPLASVNPLTATASVKYTTTGTKSASVLVMDSAGNAATCVDTTVVRGNPSINVLASPAASVPVGTSINLAATVSNFASTPTITMTTTESGIVITPVNSTTMKVDALDGLAHSSFIVVVKAQTATETATVNATLSFTSGSSSGGTLSCAFEIPNLTYNVGDIISVNVKATSGEALNVTAFYAPGAEQVESFAAWPALLKYSTTGTKNLYAYAQSSSTGKLCNNGALLQASVTVQSGSSSSGTCSVVSSPNPSGEWEWFTIRVTPGPSIAVGSFRIQVIDATSNTTGGRGYGEWQYGSDQLTAYARMYDWDSYQLKATIKNDTTGATQTCTTQHQVWSWY